MLIRSRNNESSDDIDDNDDGDEDDDKDDNDDDDNNNDDNDDDNNNNNNNNNNNDGDRVRQKRDWLGTGQLGFDSRRQQRPRSSPIIPTVQPTACLSSTVDRRALSCR